MVSVHDQASLKELPVTGSGFKHLQSSGTGADGGGRENPNPAQDRHRRVELRPVADVKHACRSPDYSATGVENAGGREHANPAQSWLAPSQSFQPYNGLCLDLGKETRSILLV